MPEVDSHEHDDMLIVDVLTKDNKSLKAYWCRDCGRVMSSAQCRIFGDLVQVIYNVGNQGQTAEYMSAREFYGVDNGRNVE